MKGRRKGYSQFCPVAKASEVFAERWTPLVLRELLCGSTRFNDLHRGLPRMSKSLLSQRLKELEWRGLIERRATGVGRAASYHLTEAGEELRPIVEQLGFWGYRWVQKEVTREELDAGLLMWDLQRNLNEQALPKGRVSVHFHFPDAEAGFRRFWLVIDRGEVDLCLDPPGHEVDLTVESDVLTMTLVWLGDLTVSQAVQSGRLSLDGPVELRRALPSWLGYSLFATGTRQAAGG